MSVNFSQCLSSLENGPGGNPVWTIVQSDDKNRPGNYWALCSQNDIQNNCSIENTLFSSQPCPKDSTVPSHPGDKALNVLNNSSCSDMLQNNNALLFNQQCPSSNVSGCGIDYTQPANISQFGTKDPNYNPCYPNQTESYQAPCCRPTQYQNLSTTWGAQKPYSL